MKSIFAVIIFLLFASCSNTSNKKPKELLIYCGITMAKPINDIARVMEKQENCNISIIIGGSENLYKTFILNQVGDLYIPGSESYVKKGIANGYILDTAFVGVNRAVMMVKKGNPKNITHNLNNLANSNLNVVIGNPNSGSVGKEAKHILVKRNIFNQVDKNVVYYTTDSKDLIPALINTDIDLTINWQATYTWDNNRNYIDTLTISNKYAKTKKLILGVLKYSKHPDIAKRVLDFAKSEKGKAIFKKYGF